MWLQACLNGSRTASEHPAVPLTPAALAADARRVFQAGAAAVHVHPRDHAGRESLDPEVVAAALTAIRKEPRILPKIAEMVIMGGGHAVGNVTPSAEFNIWVDPEAARLVMQCGRPIRLLPLDATHQALVTAEDCERLRALGTPAGIAAAACIAPRIQNYDQSQPMQRPGAPVHDALAVCAIIDSTIIQTDYIHVDVETRGELTVGRTVCDFNRRSRRDPNVHVATNADEPKFIRMLTEILGRRT